MKAAVQWLIRSVGARKAPAVADAYRTAFASPAGERVLADLARFCRAHETSFTPGDSHATAFFEGARHVYLHITQTAGLRPDELPRLPEED